MLMLLMSTGKKSPKDTTESFGGPNTELARSERIDSGVDDAAGAGG